MKTLTQKDILYPTFITAIFTIAKIWKQPKCLWRDEEDIVYTYEHIQLNHFCNIYFALYMYIYIYKSQFYIPWLNTMLCQLYLNLLKSQITR